MKVHSKSVINWGTIGSCCYLSPYRNKYWPIVNWNLTNNLNSLRPRPNRRHFADDIFKCIFENKNEWISPRISLKLVPKVRINNIPALVQIMAWRRPGDKPLSEPMMVSLLTYIGVTRPQWFNEMALKIQPFHRREIRFKMLSAQFQPFCLGVNVV